MNDDLATETLTTPAESLITPKEAETFIPPLDDMAGNHEIVGFLQRRRTQPFEGDPNMMIVGLPGTGKTVVLKSYLRERFNNPDFYAADIQAASCTRGNWSASKYDVQFFQTNISGKIYAFDAINGEMDSKSDIESKLREIYYASADHTFLLLDEAGELHFRGHDEMLRSVLTAPNITTYATAQNFHGKRRSDNRKEDDDRLRAFLRRFTQFFHTENPTDDEHIRFLARRLKGWDMKLDAPSTLRLLVLKSGGVVGYSLRALIKALCEPDRKLSKALVEDYDPDPVNR
jgi:hypothetical protein